MVQKSLLTKLMTSLFAVMTVIALLVAFVNYQLAAKNLQQRLDEETAAMVALANSSILEAVFAYDFQQIEAITKSLVNTSLVSSVRVIDHRGKPLATAQDAEQPQGQIVQQAIPIVYDGNTIGSYDITFSTQSMSDALSDQKQNNLFTVLALLAASLITVYVLF